MGDGECEGTVDCSTSAQGTERNGVRAGSRQLRESRCENMFDVESEEAMGKRQMENMARRSSSPRSVRGHSESATSEIRPSWHNLLYTMFLWYFPLLISCLHMLTPTSQLRHLHS